MIQLQEISSFAIHAFDRLLQSSSNMVTTTILLSKVTPEEGLVTASVTVKVSRPSKRISLLMRMDTQLAPVVSAVMDNRAGTVVE